MDLNAIDPKKAANDEIDKMGREIAPKLGTVYDRMIKQLKSDRAMFSKAPVRIRTVSIEQPATSRPIPDRDRLEIQISRLQGEIIEIEDGHLNKFKLHGQLSQEQIQASDELKGIGETLDASREALRNLRKDKQRTREESKALLEQIAYLAGEIDKHWRVARSNPALARVISHEALNRVEERHIGQTSRQMIERLNRSGGVARTGTFLSRAKLLQTIAEVAEYEWSKPDSALKAETRDAFEDIANQHADGRIGGLVNHGYEIGRGVRNSRVRGIVESRTTTSQYALDWVDGEGARISHLHPWVSPY